MTSLEITLFGPPQVVHDGVVVTFARRQSLALLAYLAVAGQPQSRESLAAFFWPDLDESRSRAALRHALHDLGKTIGRDWIELAGDAVRLRGEPQVRLDVARFQRLVARSHAHDHAPDRLCDECVVGLTEAVQFYQGDFMAGFAPRASVAFDDWQGFTAESLRLDLLAVLERLAETLLTRRQLDRVVSYARRWLALDPCSEAAHAVLMRVYALAGDRAAAARQYDQCVRMLAEELGMEPAPETTTLYQRLVLEPPAGASAPLLGFYNLPPDVTPFLGREAELARVAQRLAHPACRLLTILGPGGIGKTRMAVQAARNILYRFSGGVCFVDLASLVSAEQISSAILSAMRALPQSEHSLDDHLLDLVKGREMLLVLDNYEHLLSGPESDRRDGYGLVTRMLSASPGLKVLVTSRSRLNVAAEWLEPLAGMRLPLPRDAAGGMSGLRGVWERAGEARPHAVDRSDGLEQYDATALFLNCVRRLQPGYEPSPAQARAIIRICQLVEGAPLAIEMTAAWVRSVPPSEVALAIEQGLDLLTSSMHDIPERHRSMVATFEYSWRLLSLTERSILRQLSVFRGGFTHEAALAVAKAGLAELGRLSDMSWLRVEADGRYAMHELARQFCARKLQDEQLAETSEARDVVLDRHAAYFSDRCPQWYRRSLFDPAAVNEMVSELGNLLAAWDWCMARGDLRGTIHLAWLFRQLADRRGLNPEVSQMLAVATSRLRAMMGASGSSEALDQPRATALARLLILQAEGLSRFGRLAQCESCLTDAEALLEKCDSSNPGCVEARWFLDRMWMWLYWERGDLHGSQRLAWRQLVRLREDGLVLWPYQPDSLLEWEPEIYWTLGFNAIALGSYEEARLYSELGQNVARQLGSGLLWAYAARPHLRALLYLGDYERLYREAKELLTTALTFDDVACKLFAYLMLASVDQALGRWRQARAYWRRLLAQTRMARMLHSEEVALWGLGDAALVEGNLAGAQRYYEQSLSTPHPEKEEPRLGLIGLGRLALARGDPEEAVEYIRRYLMPPLPWPEYVGAALVVAAQALCQTGALLAAAELCTFLVSWRSSPHEHSLAAARLLDELSRSLPPNTLAAVSEPNSTLTLDEVIARLVGAPRSSSYTDSTTKTASRIPS